MYKISEDVIKIIEKNMKTWKKELTKGGKPTLSEDPKKYISRRCIIIVAIHNVENIQSRCKDGIWQRKMCHASKEIGKRHNRNDFD